MPLATFTIAPEPNRPPVGGSRSADVAVVLPIDFVRLPLIALIGYLMYGEKVGLLGALGSLLIVMANGESPVRRNSAEPSPQL